MSDLNQKIDYLLKRLDENTAGIRDQITELDKVQVVHGSQLAEHMRRTEIAEQSIEILKVTQSEHHGELIGLAKENIQRKKNLERFLKLLTAVVAGLLIKYLSK